MASIQINNIHQDTYKFILKVQAEMKDKKNRGQYSQAKTVIDIIDECKRLREQLNSKTSYSIFNK